MLTRYIFMNFPWPAVLVPGGPWPRTNEWEITSTLMRSGHRQGSTETIDPEAPVTRTHTHTHTHSLCTGVCVLRVCECGSVHVEEGSSRCSAQTGPPP